MNSTMIVLRLIHILTGAFWAGALFFVAGFLVPSANVSGPAGAVMMRQVMGVRKFPVFVGIAATLTVLSGISMYWHDNSISAGSFARSRGGMTYGLGAIAALITFGIAARMVAPTGEKILKLGAAIQAAGGAPTPAQISEVDALQNKIAFASRLGASFMVIAVAAMAIGRYV
jgi:uncharacterized membrane protein